MSIYYTLSQERNRELIRLYEITRKERVNAGKKVVKKEILSHVISNGMPRYSVGYEYALRKIRMIEKHGMHSSQNSQNRNLWIELYQKVKAMIARHPKMSDSEALSNVLAFGRASRFYFTYAYAKRIIYEWEKNSDRNRRA